MSKQVRVEKREHPTSLMTLDDAALKEYEEYIKSLLTVIYVEWRRRRANYD